ncbi:hypothetical protein SLEP1_g45582 [Rubroshorea leprosula]|uniref:Uncharacterized protein n=1 Tax=Rubroshorea leprosula TaxID=152421 RepID=A0AAV5LK60_9ROSI|nr:hypothetical protein SLEP1_g45582 [Rubroshorea leprosula]
MAVRWQMRQIPNPLCSLPGASVSSVYFTFSLISPSLASYCFFLLRQAKDRRRLRCLLLYSCLPQQSTTHNWLHGMLRDGTDRLALSDPCPSSDSPNFETWMQIDYQILSWIQARISTEVLQMIIQLGRSLLAKEAWDAIHTFYQNQLAAQTLFLQEEVAKRIIAQRNPFLRLLELHSLLLIEEATLLHEAANRDTQPMISPRGRWSSRRGGRRNVRGNRGRSYGGSCHFGFSITFGRGSEFSGGYFSSNHGVVSSRALPPLFPTLSTPVTCSFISCQWCQQPNLQACDCPLLPIQPMTASTSTHQSLVLLLLPLISIGILPQDIKTKNIL